MFNKLVILSYITNKYNSTLLLSYYYVKCYFLYKLKKYYITLYICIIHYFNKYIFLLLLVNI